MYPRCIIIVLSCKWGHLAIWVPPIRLLQRLFLRSRCLVSPPAKILYWVHFFRPRCIITWNRFRTVILREKLPFAWCIASWDRIWCSTLHIAFLQKSTTFLALQCITLILYCLLMRIVSRYLNGLDSVAPRGFPQNIAVSYLHSSS